MKRWKIFGIVIVTTLVIVSSSVNIIADKDKPFLSKKEVTDFLASLGIDEKTVSTMNSSGIYLSDIPDDFWSWMNISNEEGANLVKDIIYQVKTNESGALEKLIELFPVERQKPVYTFGPETLEELKSDPHMVAVYGEIPAFNGQQERQEWLDELGMVIDQVDNKMDKMVDEGSKDMKTHCINMYGIGDGYIVVDVNMEVVGRNTSLLESTYKIFEESAINAGIKDVPVAFEGEKGKLKIKNCGGRTDKYRPIEGGIQVYNGVIHNGHQYWYGSTTGYSARRYGVKGYVVAGHLGYNLVNPTPMGDIFYQPMPAEGNDAGYVTDVGGIYSDSAFVRYSDVGPYVYTVPLGLHLGMVAGYHDPWNDEYLYMSGISSGWHGGTVLLTHVTLRDGQPFPILHDQVIMSYSTLPGDSGSLVLDYGREILPGLAFVDICGINKGEITEGDYQGDTLVSPQSGVYTDIHARPLIVI